MSASPTESRGAPLIWGRDIVKRFGRVTVLDGASLDIRPGVTGLLGANGAGKTTLLGLFLGIHRAQSGTLEVLGRDPARSGAQVRSRIGYSPEHHQLPPDVRATDFVRHMAEIHGLPPAEATARASDALWWVGLGEERFRPIGTMSTGERQRVKLAMAMAHDPTLVLLDEPTDGLDPTQRESMLEMISRMSDEFGISVVLSSHLLDEVERTCDRVVVLDHGKVVACGPLQELRGAAKGIIVELDAPAFVLGAALRRRSYSVDVSGNRLTVRMRIGEDDPTRLYRIIRDEVALGGWGLRRLEPLVVTLEDVFFQGAAS